MIPALDHTFVFVQLGVDFLANFDELVRLDSNLGRRKVCVFLGQEIHSRRRTASKYNTHKMGFFVHPRKLII